jgi:hypothetical protein
MRFVFDALRVNDERVAGLTGAQWMCLGILPIALWILLKVRPQVHELELAEATTGPSTAAADADADAGEDDPVVDDAGTDLDSEPAGDPSDPDGADGADVDDGADPGPEPDAGAAADPGSDTTTDADPTRVETPPDPR